MAENELTSHQETAKIDANILTSAGQRRINVIWEITQALIAGSVVWCVLYVSSILSLASLAPNATEQQISNANTAFVFLSNIASLVVGFYFGRTNHQRIGGISSLDVSGR